MGLTMLLLVLLHLRYSTSVYHNYYVKPSLESKCPPGPWPWHDQPCKTLNEYANNTEDFKINGDIRLLFLAGTHNLTTNLSFSQLRSVQMMPEPQTPGTQVKIQLLCGDRTMIDLARVGKFTIKNLTIFGAKRSSSVVFMHPQRELSTYGVTISETSLVIVIGLVSPLAVVDGLLILVQDSLIEQSDQMGLHITFTTAADSWNANITVANSNVSHNMQGGIIVEWLSEYTQVFIMIIDSVIERNQLNTSLGSRRAVGLGVYPNHQNGVWIMISGSHFVYNEDLRGQPVVVDLNNVLEFNISDSEFRHNRGIAIQATNRIINVNYERGFNGLTLYGKVVFINNTGLQGGALALISSHAKVRFLPGVNIEFESNHAEDVGGAIFVEDDSSLYDVNNPNTENNCFYSFESLSSDSHYSISFVNNSAINGGDHMYGASVMSYCIAAVIISNYKEHLIRSNNPSIQHFFHFDDRTISPVSSNPSRVCLVDQNTHSLSPSDSCADVAQIFLSHTVFPGQIFNIKGVLVGAEFGTGVGVIYAQLLSNFDSHPKLSQNQYWQRVLEPTVFQFNYSVFSNASREVLVLSAVSAKYFAIGDKNQIAQAIQTYNNSGVVPPTLLTTPVFINVALSNCPLGFYFEPKSMGCICNPILCTFSNGTGLFKLHDIWVNAHNKGRVSGIIVHYNCPFDYCNIETDGVDLHDPDTQCTMNHTGILCGKCAPELSLALGSNKCLPCSNNNHLALFIFFAAAGFLLVFFIKILNITVSQGTINGLIFYANIMWAYQSIFFSHDEEANLWFLKTFIAWLNLDFGIEICFIQGLTAYTKTWLQFVFPFYVWSIAGGMILLARCSQKMTRLLGNNSVQVLATLFLLSYAKLLRTTITALMPATLYVFADNGKPIANQTQVVWAFDGNLLYGQMPHIFLLIVALLVLLFLWLPYTFVLLFIQLLRSGSEHRCLQWVNSWKPLFDAYTGPLNGINQFWVGLLLLARFVLLLTFTLTYTSSPSTSVLALVMTILLLFTVLSYTGQVYDNPTKFNVRLFPEKVSFKSILEISFLFNLVVVGGSFLYFNINPETSVTCASVSCAFLQFIGIVIYHFCCALKSCRKSLLKGHRNLDDRADAVAMPTTTTVGVDVNEPLSIADHSRYGSVQAHEPLLTGSMSDAIADTY